MQPFKLQMRSGGRISAAEKKRKYRHRRCILGHHCYIICMRRIKHIHIQNKRFLCCFREFAATLPAGRQSICFTSFEPFALLPFSKWVPSTTGQWELCLFSTSKNTWSTELPCPGRKKKKKKLAGSLLSHTARDQMKNGGRRSEDDWTLLYPRGASLLSPPGLQSHCDAIGATRANCRVHKRTWGGPWMSFQSLFLRKRGSLLFSGLRNWA